MFKVQSKSSMRQLLFMLATAFTLAATPTLNAQAQDVFSDDSDLTGIDFFPRRFAVPRTLYPDHIVQVKETPGRADLRFYVERDGEYHPVTGLQAPITEDLAAESDLFGSMEFYCSDDLSLTIPTRREGRFSIGGNSSNYNIVVSAPCGYQYDVLFDEGTDAGELMALFETVSRAEAKLAQSVDMRFWNRVIEVMWPADGDYYAWGTVHVTKGYQWDIVGHEFGHAIYDLAALGGMGGGEHRIDECYSEALALSEGWASFFAAWLYVDLADPDARFQYMVPRRAPIQFENIPEDVCPGPRNEWRTTGFFWDLIDHHADGEMITRHFSETWSALLGTRASGPRSAYSLLMSAGIPEEELSRSWELNFQNSPPRH